MSHILQIEKDKPVVAWLGSLVAALAVVAAMCVLWRRLVPVHAGRARLGLHRSRREFHRVVSLDSPFAARWQRECCPHLVRTWDIWSLNGTQRADCTWRTEGDFKASQSGGLQQSINVLHRSTKRVGAGRFHRRNHARSIGTAPTAWVR